MCGIAGIVGLPSEGSESIIQGMVQRLDHRGPDDSAIAVYENVAFGQSRLSIIDINIRSNQPFFDANRKFMLVYNGELYNYKELRDTIDYPWQTTSDTEVVLAAFIRFGAKCLNFFNGMYALAIWDFEKEELFVARDKIGVKPFYYHKNGNVFLFSSELRSLVKSGNVTPKVDLTSISEYLMFMAVPSTNTIISKVEQLPAGHFGILKNGNWQIQEFWSLKNQNINRANNELSYNETVKKTKSLLEASIERRMVADVPVSAFLSGGLDSSAIVALMAKSSSQRIQTFSLAFSDKDLDESEFAEIIAQKFNTDHHSVAMDAMAILDELPSYFSKMDSPTVDGLNTYMVSRMVSKNGIKVAMSGLGGDELFGGYSGFNRYRKFLQFKHFFTNPISKEILGEISNLIKSRTWLKINELVNGTENSDLAKFYRSNRSIFLRQELERLLISKPSSRKINSLEFESNQIDNFQYMSQYTIAELSNYTLDVLLKDTDQMSMAWGLEVREPFFDVPLVEFLLSVPDKFKSKSNYSKRLLVDALIDDLPKEILYREKKGFVFPMELWLRNEWKDFAKESFERLSKRDFFDKMELFKCLASFMKNENGITWMHIWSLIVLENWLKENRLEL